MNDKEFEAFRSALCDAAARIVARHGIDALTLRLLASEVGCSRQTPYRYFRSKDDLLEEVYVRCHDVFIRYCDDAVSDVNDPREKLRNIRDAYLRFYRDEPDIYKVLSGPKPSTRMTRVAKQAMYVHSRLRSFFDEAIAEGFDYGDSDSLAYLFWNSIDSLAKLQTQQADNKALNVEAISNLVEDMYFPAATSRLEVRKRA